MENTIILGLGSVGAVFGLFLQKSKRTTLSAVARSNYENVKSGGMHVEAPPQLEGGGVVKFDHVFRALDSSSMNSHPHDEPLSLTFSYIVITTKLSVAKPSLVECLKPFVVPGKSILVLIQNGVGIEDEIQNQWPENLVITCVSYVGATQKAPGVVEHQRGRLLYAGPFHANGSTDCADPERERIDTFISMVNSGGGNATPIYNHVHMQAARWTKLASNVALSPVTALTDLDTGAYLQSSPLAESLMRRLIAEISIISRALGIEIDPLEPGVLEPLEAEEYAAAIGRQGRLADMLINRVKDAGPITNSMRTDVQNKRPVEVDAILGVPLRHAKRLGIDTPVLETLWILVTAVDARNSGKVKALV